MNIQLIAMLVGWLLVTLVSMHAAAWATNSWARWQSHGYERPKTGQRLIRAHRVSRITMTVTSLIVLAWTVLTFWSFIDFAEANKGRNIGALYGMVGLGVSLVWWVGYMALAYTRWLRGLPVAWPLGVPKSSVA